MYILKVALITAGLVLIIIGLYDAFVPKEVLDLGVIEVSSTEGLSNQSWAKIGLGALALVAGLFIKKRK